MSAATATANEPSPASGEEELPDALKVVQWCLALVLLKGAYYGVDRAKLEAQRQAGRAPELELLKQSDVALRIRRLLRAEFPQADASRIVTEFFESPATTCYEGIEFNPKETTPGYLNLWVGPTIQPQAGDSEPIKEFLFLVICAGDWRLYEYLVSYLAHALQRPWEKPGVMITLLGGQGTGKGTLARILQRIWGATFLQAHNIDEITGSFNGSLENAYIVFLDEALFVGDRRGTNALKSLVTEPVIQINQKHQPCRSIDSYHRFFLATNAEHLKHTERDDRRDFALRLSDMRKGDHGYWTRLYAAIDNGAVEAFAADLLARDLSDFNVRDKPQTEELLEQKLLSLEGIDQWWFGCLEQGVIPPHGGWTDFLGTGEGISEVVSVRGIKLHKKPSSREFVQVIARLCPSAKATQRRTGNTRQRGLELPDLEQARKDFEAWIGGAIDW